MDIYHSCLKCSLHNSSIPHGNSAMFFSTNATGRFEVKIEKSKAIPRFETLELPPIRCLCLNIQKKFPPYTPDKRHYNMVLCGSSRELRAKLLGMDCFFNKSRWNYIYTL